MVAREQIADVLIGSLTSEAARGKTFELVAEPGPVPQDLDPLFEALGADADAGVDGIWDAENMPLAYEPVEVLDDLERLSTQRIGIHATSSLVG